MEVSQQSATLASAEDKYKERRLEKQAMKERLLALGLMVYQIRKVAGRHSGYFTLYHTMSTMPVSCFMAEYDLTQVSVLLLSNLLFFMKTMSNGPPSFEITDMEEFKGHSTLACHGPVNESVFRFLALLDIPAIEISALNHEHRVSENQDLVRLLLSGRNCPFLGPLEETLVAPLTMDRLKWAMDHALVQLHTPLGILRDTTIQDRDLCGDFDLPRAIEHDAQKFCDCLGLTRSHSHALMKGFPVFQGEMECYYDRMVTVALDYDSEPKTPKARADESVAREVEAREEWAEVMAPVGEAMLAELDKCAETEEEKGRKLEDSGWAEVMIPARDTKAEAQRSKIIREHLGTGARVCLYKHVCYMETQMRNITPRIFRLARFDHDHYKKWTKSVNWDREKTHFPRKMKSLAPPQAGVISGVRFIDGKVTYLDGKTDILLVRARICFDLDWRDEQNVKKRRMDPSL